MMHTLGLICGFVLNAPKILWVLLGYICLNARLLIRSVPDAFVFIVFAIRHPRHAWALARGVQKFKAVQKSQRQFLAQMDAARLDRLRNPTLYRGR